MYFGSNIKLLRKRRERSQEDLANALQIKRSSLSGYEIGSFEPNLETLIKISDFFKISTDKLLKYDLSKISEMQLSEIEKGYDIDISGNKLRVLATTIGEDNEENIEMVGVRAKAGYATGFGDPDFISVLPTFRLPFLSRERKYRSFQTIGDSMPPVPDGSWVTGEYLQNWDHIKNGYPYIVVLREDGVIFKIVHNRIEERKTLLLSSTNPIYDPYEVPISEVMEIWKFVNFISSELPEPNLSKDEMSSTIMELQRQVNEIRNTMKREEN